ncbi:hypothetical protein BDV33DRAFT_184491 [Aspergillus novoparasiticus]|uniref:Clr5 domain-containing protein n=1 Tax=Aspergillus novoparasiticus TaxID=986946 RepID=A0A5N6E7N6_9EURO|nr:hypothetical protein BDV33DRAFT_184491 [Aspergillus novoparasiticus]
MKDNLSSDTWENKKHLIIELYKGEGWPVKQVIKRLRTSNFNPSDGQLRSRLKKWGITKSSRSRRVKNSINTKGVDSCNTAQFKHTTLDGGKSILSNTENGRSKPTDIYNATNCNYGPNKTEPYVRQYTESKLQSSCRICTAMPPTVHLRQPEYVVSPGYYSNTSSSENYMATPEPAVEGVEVVNWPWPLPQSVPLDPRLTTQGTLSYQGLGPATGCIAEQACLPSGFYCLSGMSQ